MIRLHDLSLSFDGRQVLKNCKKVEDDCEIFF